MVLCLTVLATGCPRPVPVKTGPPPLERKPAVSNKLSNGLNVVIQENHSAPVVALQMWVNTGSSSDPVGREGMAHVLEHMIFKGTASRSEGQIAREIEGAGGQINAWTSHDQTVFHVVIASRFFDRAAEVLADALQNARFDKDDLARELKVIQEEIKMGEDSPGKVVSQNLFGTAYGKHHYRRPVIGRASSVRKMTRQDVVAFHKQHYNPANMTLVVVGDVTRAQVSRQVARHFKGGKRRVPAMSAGPVEPAQRKLRVVARHRPGQEVHLSMGFRIPEMQDPATPVLDLAAIVLGEGESSRLVRRVKNERQLLTHVQAYAYTPKDPGLLVISASVTPEKLEAAVEGIMVEVLQLGGGDVAADELRRAKTIVESDGVYQKETVQGQARKLGFYHTVAGGAEFELRYNRRVSGTTAEQLRQVAGRFLKPQGLTISVVGPAKGGNKGEADLAAAVKRGVERASARMLKAGAIERRAVSRQAVRVKLPNGARLLVRQDSTVPLVSMRAVWLGGLRYENTRNNGTNNLLAALITRGTTSRNADQVNEAIEKMAGVISGFSGYNSFGIQAELLASQWEQGLEILADCVLHPAFEEREVERARRQAVEDILAQKDNPSSVAMELFSRTLFRKHPYRFGLLGRAETVSGITRGSIVRYFRRHFGPGKLVISVVGDVDPERVILKFGQLFGVAERATVAPPRVPVEPPRKEPEDAFKLLDRQQAHIVLGYPGTSLRRKDRFALEVLANLLSGQSGRLFLQLRERQGLAYNVGAFSMEGLEPGYFAVYMATSPKNLQAALAGIEAELQKVRDQPVGQGELRRVQRYMVGSYETSLQRKSTVASYLAFGELYGLGHESYTRYAEAIMAVTAEDVRRAARRYLRADRRVVSVVKPEEYSPGAARRLPSDGQAGILKEGAKRPKRRRRGKKRKSKKR